MPEVDTCVAGILRVNVDIRSSLPKQKPLHRSFSRTHLSNTCSQQSQLLKLASKFMTSVGQMSTALSSLSLCTCSHIPSTSFSRAPSALPLYRPRRVTVRASSSPIPRPSDKNNVSGGHSAVIDKAEKEPRTGDKSFGAGPETINGQFQTSAEGLTPLQQHVAFFDRDGDGIVYPWETYVGFRALGFNTIISFLAVVLINGSMSYPTLDSWIPSLLFPIYIKNIERAIHGSDTRVYNNEGGIVKQEFEEMFAKFALSRPNAMSFNELLKMTERNRDAYDLFGWAANKLEWAITFELAKDDKGYVSKEAIAGVYDGSFFHYVEKQRNKSTSN